MAPHLAPGFNEDIRKTVLKIDKPDDILIESLGHAQVVMEFSPQQLQTIAQKASIEKITVMKNTVEKEFSALDPANIDKIKKEIIGEPGKTSPSRETRNKALRELAEKDPYTEKVARAKLATSSPAWQI